MTVGKQTQTQQSINGDLLHITVDPCSGSELIDKTTLKKWKNRKQKSKKWASLDTFESVFTTVDWKLWLTGLFMHDSCCIKLCSPRKLYQEEILKEKQLQSVVSEDRSSCSSSTTVTDESFSSPPPKRTHTAGIVHNKTKDIWCFKFLPSEHGHLSKSIPFY